MLPWKIICPRSCLLLMLHISTTASQGVSQCSAAIGTQNKQLLEKRQSFGTDWVTVYLTSTLPPGERSTSIQTDTLTYTLPPGATIYRTVYVPGPTQTVVSVQEPDPTTIWDSPTTCWWNCDATTEPPNPSVSSTRTITSTRTSVTAAPAQVKRPCLPGDQNEKVDYGPLRPTHTQTITLIILGIYILVIWFGWSFVGIRNLLYPIKMLVTTWHEFGHALGVAFLLPPAKDQFDVSVQVIIGGRRLAQLSVDPNEGGAVVVEGGSYPLSALPLGFVFNMLIGGLLVFAGFSTIASKIASFFVGMSMLVCLYLGLGIVSKGLQAGALGLLIGFWFIDHGSVLRYYILFIGVMSALYVIWDTMDDLVFRKIHPCCARLWAMTIPSLPPHLWALVWLGISIFFLIMFIIAALATWRETGHGMYCQSQTFLPT